MSKNSLAIVAIGLWLALCIAGAISARAQLPPIELKQETSRVISITGDIEPRMADNIINQLKQLDKENHNEITINITSYGGEVYPALQIVDEMKAVKSTVHTVCEGYCMSAAAMILSSGSKGHREAMPNATIMVHQVSSKLDGNVTEMQKQLDEVNRLNTVMLSIFEQNTGLSHQQIKELTSFDDFMSPPQAVQCGLIDNIKIGST